MRDTKAALKTAIEKEKPQKKIQKARHGHKPYFSAKEINIL